jgi:uncharacterized protein
LGWKAPIVTFYDGVRFASYGLGMKFNSMHATAVKYGVGMRCVLIAAAVFAALAVPAAAAGLGGQWAGVWVKEGDSLPVTVTFVATSQGENGSFDSDALQVAGIPFAEVKHDGNKVHWVLRGDTSVTEFDGTLKGNRLDGALIEAGKAGHFSLMRQKQTKTPVESTDVSFQHDGITLAGTVLRPTGQSARRRPGIVFAHGSGPEGRWANRYLATRFAEAGFVALITDKRGVGGSSGDWKTASLADFAADAESGIAFLRAQPDVDPERIGIFGHSQGGWVAPLVASQDARMAFVIASSASGIDLAETEEYSLANALGVQRLPPEDASEAKAFVHAIVATAYRGASYDRLKTTIAPFAKRQWYFDPPPANDYYWSFARKLAAFSPFDTWRNVRAHVLLLYGEDDERIPVEPSIAAITAALKAGGHGAPTVNVFAHADHTFRIEGKGWHKRVPGYADLMIAWTTAHVARTAAH